jgi:tetratricopeptide (TPR) repeat protein
VSVQVTDVLARRVPWSEQYDRALDESFALQDEITERIVTALEVKLASGEQARVWHKCLVDPKAREHFYRGTQAFVRMNQESMASARASFLRLAELAPDSPFGPTWIALCLWFESTRGWAANPTEAREQAGTWAERAVAMEDADGQAHTVLGNVRLLQRRFDEALAIAHEALEIRPGCTNANGFLANVLLYCGEPLKAVVHARRAIRYMPVYPPWFVEILAAAYRDAGTHDFSIIVAREVVRIAPTTLNGRLTLAGALARCGWPAEGRRVAGETRELNANLSLERWAASQPYRDANVLADLVDDLGKLGIPQ